MPEFDPIDKDPVHEKVYQRLRVALMRGEFRPGQSVSIRRLAEDFGTSPMPVREALRRLVAEQAFRRLSNRTFAVPEISASRLEELRSVRVLVEGKAMLKAVPKE